MDEGLSTDPLVGYHLAINCAGGEVIKLPFGIVLSFFFYFALVVRREHLAWMMRRKPQSVFHLHQLPDF